jgi:aminopeptidase YwaD
VDSSGMGPSDHSSFYQTGIPVLFFFTGTHKDYHKPSDDAHLLNYKGMADIGEFIMDIVTQMDKQPKPVFTPTKQQSTGRTRFKVTLGIIPDYSYQEGGVKVDGVSENKPAAAAGLQTGDIIIQMGDIEVKSMQSYMEALGSFNPGDETIVVVRRGEEQIKLNLVFTKP